MEVKDLQIQTVLPHTCLLGEGPVWDHDNGCIFWVDILEGIIHRVRMADQKHDEFVTYQLVGAIVLMRSGGIMAALQYGFYSIDFDTGRMQFISDPEVNRPGNRFNDGKCDPAGRFWAGTMSLAGTKEKGGLYTLEADLSVRCIVDKVTCSNGMAWSSDGKSLYYIDSGAQQVVAFDYQIRDGSLSNKRTVIQVPPAHGIPDGMTIDDEGMLWVALWNGWSLNRYNPQTGELLDQILLPVSLITSCTFGSEDLTDLYITSAKTGLNAADLEKQPLAGSLFRIKNTGFKGMETTKFDG